MLVEGLFCLCVAMVESLRSRVEEFARFFSRPTAMKAIGNRRARELVALLRELLSEVENAYSSIEGLRREVEALRARVAELEYALNKCGRDLRDVEKFLADCRQNLILASQRERDCEAVLRRVRRLVREGRVSEVVEVFREREVEA